MTILVAHPFKHHAYELAAGISACLPLELYTPLYRKNVGAILAHIPSEIGRKAHGYHSEMLDPKLVRSPPTWQIRKLISLATDYTSIVKPFDAWIAKLLVKEKGKFTTLVTLQDYMPLAVETAKKLEMTIWNDQISNQSPEAIARINSHERTLKLQETSGENESTNTRIVGLSDVVTVPSTYTLDGLKNLLCKSPTVQTIPYGVATNIFTPRQKQREAGLLKIVARANNCRKGGHLFMGALLALKNELSSIATRIEISIIGAPGRELSPYISEIAAWDKFSIEAKPVPHKDMPALLRNADLFVMPALSESLSLQCLEALSAGLPSVITPYCGIDGFKDNIHGYICADNVCSVREAIVRAIQNIDRDAEMRSACRSFAESRTWENYRSAIGKLALQVSQF